MVKDYYKLLEISNDASVDLIHNQCQKIIRHYNKFPEKYDNVGKKILQIERIENLLSDRIKREEYNRLLFDSNKKDLVNDTKFCKKCGKIIAKDSQFCKFCGESIKSTSSNTCKDCPKSSVSSKLQNKNSEKINDANSIIKEDYSGYILKKIAYFFDFSFLKSKRVIFLWICLFSLASIFSLFFVGGLLGIFGIIGFLCGCIILFPLSFIVVTKICEIYYPMMIRWQNTAMDKHNLSKNQYILYIILIIISSLLLRGLIKLALKG